MRVFRESTNEYVKIRRATEGIVEDIISNAIDNIAMVVHSKLPEYNPDWCIESEYNYFADDLDMAIEKLSKEVVKGLFANYT